MATFPRPRSPNPACGFPAPGSPVGSCPSHTGHRVGLGAGPVIPADHARCTTAIVPPASFPVCRRACSRPGGVEPFACACDTFRTLCLRGGVIGYSHSRRPSSFACPSTPEAPCLDRHYPASSVLRASPPPCRPGLVLTDFRFGRAPDRQGFPCCHVSHLPCMPAPIPRRERCGASVACFPHRHRPSPYGRWVGSRITLFEACSAFTRVPACMVAELLNATLLAQQQGTGIRGDGAAVESSDDLAPVKGFKFELFAATVCLHRTPLRNLSGTWNVSVMKELFQILGADAPISNPLV